MKPISQILSPTENFEFEESSGTQVKLSESISTQMNGHHTPDQGIPKGVKETPRRDRIAMSELELTYVKNPVVFNSLNKIIQTLMASPHKVRARKASVQKAFDFFLANIGRTGEYVTWEELLSQILKFQTIYGWSWVENIFKEGTKEIVDWSMLDPKRMDYLRENSSGISKADPAHNDAKIILDRQGRPLGYVLNRDNRYLSPFTKDTDAPAEIQKYLGEDQIFFERERVALFKFFTVGDQLYPIGLVEPIYQVSLQKMNVQEAMTNNIFRHGAPIIVAELGDQNHEPSPQQIQNILEKLKKVKTNSEIAVPYYYNIKFLESKSADKLKPTLKYYQDNEIAGMGIPQPYATGGGESTNRATLNNQDNLFQLSLRDLIRRTCESIRKQMFMPLAVSLGFKAEDAPYLEWDIAGVEELDRKVSRFNDYLDKGVFTAEELRPIIMRLESLSEDDLNGI